MEPTTWQNLALQKNLELQIAADSKRAHMLEIQRRIRDVGDNLRESSEAVTQCQADWNHNGRTVQAKSRLDAATEESASLSGLRKSLIDQSSKLSPSVTDASRLAGAANHLLTNLKLLKA